MLSHRRHEFNESADSEGRLSIKEPVFFTHPNSPGMVNELHPIVASFDDFKKHLLELMDAGMLCDSAGSSSFNDSATRGFGLYGGGIVDRNDSYSSESHLAGRRGKAFCLLGLLLACCLLKPHSLSPALTGTDHTPLTTRADHTR